MSGRGVCDLFWKRIRASQFLTHRRIIRYPALAKVTEFPVVGLPVVGPGYIKKDKQDNWDYFWFYKLDFATHILNSQMTEGRVSQTLYCPWIDKRDNFDIFVLQLNLFCLQFSFGYIGSTVVLTKMCRKRMI